MRTRERSTVVLLLAFAAAVRALRFWSEITWPLADQVRDAVPALQILDGTFPVQHVGAEYHGAAISYPLAAWFALAGRSPIMLDVFCYALGLGFVVTSSLIARRMLPSGAVIMTLAVLAVPPLLLAQWSLHGNLNYPVTLIIGNLLLLGTHAIMFRRANWVALLLALGLLAGVGWWGNPLVVLYCVPFGILALRTGLIRRSAFWLFPVGLVLGGLPEWIYELLNYPTARLMVHQAGNVPAQSFGTRAGALFGDIALQLFGATEVEGFLPPLAAQVALMGLAALTVARALVRDRAELRWLVGAGKDAGPGLGILWLLLAANLLAVLPAKRALGPAYLLPLYSVLPIWTGECLWWLWRRHRGLGAGVLAGLLVFHLWANWAVTLGRGPRATPRWAPLQDTVHPLTDWLTARGIRRVYWIADVGIPSFEFSYLTGMRVIAAHIWAESVIQHAHVVDAESAPPIVTTPDNLPELRDSLRGLSLELEETPVGRFVIVEARPTDRRGFTALSPAGWTVTTSHRPQDAGLLIDRDAGTGWSTGERQVPGQWLMVDLGREEEVARVDLLAIDWQEVPAGFRVERSRDGVHWATAVSVPHYWGPLFWSERHAFLKVRRGRVQAIFEPVRTRYLRVIQEGLSTHAWAAREVFVYGPAAPAVAAPLPEGALTAALGDEGVHFLYANPWLSARIRVESRESIGTLESTSTVNSYGRAEPEPSVLERFRPRPDRAVLLDAESDVTAVRGVLTERGVLARERMVGPYRLLVLKAEAPRRALERKGWQASASVGGATAGRAVDGDARTRWTSAGPVDPAASFTVELDQPRRVTGLEVAPGSREGGPADYAVEGSTDGRTWTPLGPTTWAGALFWSGTELLRNSRPEWAVTFPAATVRFLRLRPAAPAPTWSIVEIEVFGAS